MMSESTVYFFGCHGGVDVALSLHRKQIQTCIIDARQQNPNRYREKERENLNYSIE